MYKLAPLINNIQTAVIRLDDMAWITLDPTNTDYVAYLKWLEEGNVPEPADDA